MAGIGATPAVKPRVIRYLVAALMGAALIGLSPILVRLVHLGPLSTGFYRFAFSLPVLFSWMFFERRTEPAPVLSRRDYILMIVGGAFFALDIALWNLSLSHTSVVNSAIFNNCAAFFVPLLLWMVFAQKPQPVFLAAALVAFCGSIMLAANGRSIHFASGDIFALMAGFGFAMYIVTVKEVRARVSTATIMWWTGLVSAICLGVITWLSGATLIPGSLSDWGVLVALAICVHIGGQGLLTYSMGNLSAGFTAIVMLTAPITASVLAWSLFGEALTFQKIMGGVLVLSSIIITRLSEKA